MRRKNIRAHKTEIDGYKFPSGHEAQVYLYHKEQLAQGEISNLKVHPKIILRNIDLEILTLDGKKPRVYTPDLMFEVLVGEEADPISGFIVVTRKIIVEAKGVLTDEESFKYSTVAAMFPEYEFRIFIQGGRTIILNGL